MSTQRRGFSRSPRLAPTLGATIVALAALTSVSAAQELPEFRHGLWEFKRTVTDASGKMQTLSSRKCTSPTADMRRQNAMLAKAGCEFSPIARNGNAYRFTSRCNIQGMKAQSTSVVSASGDAAYQVDVESQQGAMQTREQLIARRIGDC